MVNQMIKKMGFVFMLSLLSSRLVVGEPSAGKSADSDIQPLTILSHHCAGCHQAADHPGALFLNAARLTEPETVKLMIHLIETSQMPPAHAEFKKTADGKKLLKWLKAQQGKKTK